MATEVREWGITIAILGAAAIGIYVAYQFAVQQGWLGTFQPRLTRMQRYQRRLAPPRRTEAERRRVHAALYGRGALLPRRRYRFRRSIIVVRR